MKKWGHDELAHDLAILKANGNRVVFENIPMGSVLMGSVSRPDVFTIRKSFTQPRPTTYEIKVSRADFLSDIRSGKWQSYRPYSERIYFACPDGLISKDEVPKECGLIVRKAKVWRKLKSCYLPQEINTVSMELLVKLMIATHSGERCTDGGYRKHLENRHRAVAHIGVLLGQDVADFCSKNFETRERMQSETYEANKIIKAVREITGTASWRGPWAVIEDLKKFTPPPKQRINDE